MRRIFGMLIAMVFAVSIMSIALARGAPKQKAFTSEAAVVSVAPVIMNAPTMIGYDVIQNISKESRDLSIAQNTLKVDTSARTRLSTTGDERLINVELTGSLTCRSAPARVLLA